MYLKSTTVLAHAGLNATLHPDPLRLSVDKKGATLCPRESSLHDAHQSWGSPRTLSTPSSRPLSSLPGSSSGLQGRKEQRRKQNLRARRTHVGHADAGAEGDLALGLHGVELGQDAAGVRGERGQHLTVTGNGKAFPPFQV